MNYGQVMSALGRWAAGNRMLHDLVVHPLMALTNYHPALLKLHDYHAFAAAHPTKDRLVGVTGPQCVYEETLAELARRGGEVVHNHSDGLLCFGIVRLPDKPDEDRREEHCAHSWDVDWDGYYQRCRNCGKRETKSDHDLDDDD